MRNGESEPVGGGARSLAETSGELLTVLGADDACCNSLVEGVSAGESSGSCSAFGAES
jgi:hypothetical protein